jgi:flavin-dependent dehydrogenase
LILGGGPAACATALGLREELPGAAPEVSLWFAAPKPERPAIGETVPPAATPALAGLGLSGLLQQYPHLPCPGSVSVWGDERPGHNDFLLQPVGKGYHLDRAAFDARLRESTGKCNCRMESGWRLRRVRALAPGYELLFHDGRNSRRETVDFVVDASGIGAAFSRRIGIARNTLDEVIALCAVLPIDHRGQPAHTLIQAVDLGWWYGARLPGNRAIVSFTTDADTLKKRSLAKPANWYRAWLASGWFAAQCRHRFGAPLSRPATLHPRPLPSSILSAVVGTDWLAVGDAASSYDAMTSAGITKALLHGRAAGQALARYLAGDGGAALQGYQDRVFSDFNTYLGLHQRYYRAEKRFPEAGFWRRRRLIG